MTNYPPIRLALVLALSSLSSCGGGGGGDKTLVADFSFNPHYAYLWRDTSINVTTSGLEGNTPICVTPSSSSLPAGLSFTPNSCRIVGVPTSAEPVGGIAVRLTVAGFEGQVEKFTPFAILGPPIYFSYLAPITVGYPLVYAPYSGGDVPAGTPDWTPAPGETLVYALAAGQLPPGLKLDPLTGTVFGVLTGQAKSSFSISVVAQSNGRTYTKTSQTITLNTLDGFAFGYFGPPATVGQSYSQAPNFTYPYGKTSVDYVFSGYRLSPTSSPLPAGLMIDPISGVISGIASTSGQTSLRIQADVTTGGQTGVAETARTLYVLLSIL